jgi:hypothetical protein
VLAAGVTVFELARVIGTSARMIEKHYGALLDGAHTGIASRLDAHEAELHKAVGEERGEALAWANVRAMSTRATPTSSSGLAEEAGGGVTDQLRTDEEEEHRHDHCIVTGQPASEAVQQLARPVAERD